MKKTVLSPLLLTLMVLSSFFFAFKSTAAQTGTTVFFSPDPANVYLNGTNSQVVEVWVGDVVEMNAFDITVEYDPAIVNLVSWTTGTFLEVYPSQCFQNPQHPIEPGYFQIICTQFAKPKKTGSGVLLKLTFSGLSFGSTALTLTNPEFSAGTPLVTIYPTPINGTLNVTYDPTTVKYTSLSGNISLQGQSLRGGIPVSLETGLYVGYGPYNTLSLPQPDNNYFFTSIVMDAYPIRTAFPTYLNLDASSNKVKGMVGATNTLPMLVLRAGNVNTADNEINTNDLDLIRDSFDLNTRMFRSSVKLSGDANGDGIVDIRDLALAGGNYGLNGATAYLDWMP